MWPDGTREEPRRRERGRSISSHDCMLCGWVLGERVRLKLRKRDNCRAQQLVAVRVRSLGRRGSGTGASPGICRGTIAEGPGGRPYKTGGKDGNRNKRGAEKRGKGAEGGKASYEKSVVLKFSSPITTLPSKPKEKRSQWSKTGKRERE